MKVAVLGLGYVGLTTAVCVANDEHEVVGFDTDVDRVKMLDGGQCPFYEPNLPVLLEKGLAYGSLTFDHSISRALQDADLAIVCVGTPSRPDGSLDMTSICEVSTQIADEVSVKDRPSITVAYRSTMILGAIDEVIVPIFQNRLGPGFDKRVKLVCNPEFLREGTAVDDYFHPPKVVVGTRDGLPNAVMEQLHRNLTCPRFHLQAREAEVIKLVDNTWHATKVAFANEVGRICQTNQVDPQTIYKSFIADEKLNISPYYLRPGGAFGGSCLPKDVRAMQALAARSDVSAPLVSAVLASNDRHKAYLLSCITQNVAAGGRILICGLAFKAATDDLRESPNLDILQGLLDMGYAVSVFDPHISAVPGHDGILVSKDAAENDHFDLLVATNKTFRLLSCPKTKVLDLDALR